MEPLVFFVCVSVPFFVSMGFGGFFGARTVDGAGF